MAAERLERAVHKARSVGLEVDGVKLPLRLTVRDDDGEDLAEDI